MSQRVRLLGPHPSSNLKSSSIRTGILSRIAGRPRRGAASTTVGAEVVNKHTSSKEDPPTAPIETPDGAEVIRQNGFQDPHL